MSGPDPGAKASRKQHVLTPTRIVLVRPLYPENLGAVARAMHVTGFRELWLVSPGPLASITHEQARRMAVGSHEVLDQARIVSSLEAAIEGCRPVVGTSARARISGVMSPRQVASWLRTSASDGAAALVFGGERNGLSRHEVARCERVIRIPMVANEPSLNLAQAAMIVLYELLVAAWEAERPAEAERFTTETRRH